MQENKFRQKKQKKRNYFIHIVNIFTSLCSWHYLNREAFTNKAANLIVVISIQSNETEVAYYHGHKMKVEHRQPTNSVAVCGKRWATVSVNNPSRLDSLRSETRFLYSYGWFDIHAPFFSNSKFVPSRTKFCS